MKTIILHDGRKAHFPDNAPHEVVASTLAKLLSEGGGNTKSDVVTRATQRVEGARQKLADDEKGKKDQAQREEAEKLEAKQESQRREKKEDDRHVQIIGAHAAGIKATNDHAAKITKGMADIGKGLQMGHAKLGELADKLPDFNKAVEAIEELGEHIQGLEKAITKAAADIIKVMKAPKKIARSERGRVNAIEVEEGEG